MAQLRVLARSGIKGGTSVQEGRHQPQATDANVNFVVIWRRPRFGLAVSEAASVYSWFAAVTLLGQVAASLV
jgi:hypothetical protein